MILEKALRALLDFFLWASTNLTLPGVPEWALSSYTATRLALVGLKPLCSWVPWDLTATVFAGVVATWVWAMGAAGFKQFISLVTGGGGK